MKELDLAWGHPKFLEPYWKKIKLKLNEQVPSSYLFGALPELKAAIRSIHAQEKNANAEGKFIVVGNGASQILTATIACLNKPVCAEEPYFSRFPKYAALARVPWKYCPKGYQIITVPNNPDGYEYPFFLLNGRSSGGSIFDLSYNWKPYSSKVREFNEDIMVFSLSKATGHASTRIGWGIFKDEALARQVAEYIEHTTGGVSIETQQKATAILHSQLGAKETCFEYGRRIMQARWDILISLNSPLNILSSNGMFLWGIHLNPKDYLNKNKILFAPGTDFGCSDFYFRLNVGCSENEFKELIKRVK